MVVIAIDPGANTGWAVYDHDHLFLSGENKLDVAVQTVMGHMEGKHVDAFAIENMYFGPGKASPKSMYKLGYNTGYIVGMFEPYLSKDTVRWNPQPVEWRGVLGFTRGTRDEMAKLALEKAEAIASQKLEGPRGGKQTDRAMAICIGTAMIKRLKGEEDESSKNKKRKGKRKAKGAKKKKSKTGP